MVPLQQALSRRTLLRVGGLGLLGLTMPKLLRAAESVQPGAALPRVRAKRVIFLFQWGGPSHVDMFDMKPGAPDQYRSPLTPIRSSCPEIQVCEQLPETAKRLHKVSLIRTLTHTMKNHNSAGYYALSGHAPPTDDQRLRDSLGRRQVKKGVAFDGDVHLHADTLANLAQRLHRLLDIGPGNVQSAVTVGSPVKGPELHRGNTLGQQFLGEVSCCKMR